VQRKKTLLGVAYAGIILALFGVAALTFFPHKSDPMSLDSPSVTVASLNRTMSASRAKEDDSTADALAAQHQAALETIDKQRAKHEKTLVIPVTKFTMATFNVQGSSHRGGGASRVLRAMSLLQGNSVDVASLQEVQRNQRAAILGSYGGTYGMYPAMNAREGDAHNQVIWRKSRFELVTGTTRTYHYFRGQARRMPLVKLRDKDTQAEFWVTSYHNPASGVLGMGNQAGWRARNVSMQIRDANAIIATGVPLIIAGDMNDRNTYFCAMVMNTSMHASDGGSDNGGCHPPGEHNIDWIMGSPLIEFSGHVRLDNGVVNATSDHPLYFTQVVATGKRIRGH
jgi:endonuclease/exonuclease/phosphatase family metal-dependent hydrolase